MRTPTASSPSRFQVLPAVAPAFTAPDRLVRLPEVLQLVGLSRSALYERMANGAFPSSRNIGMRSVAWTLSEIEAWIAARPLTIVPD